MYIMSLEMDGAGACNGLLAPDDKACASSPAKHPHTSPRLSPAPLSCSFSPFPCLGNAPFPVLERPFSFFGNAAFLFWQVLEVDGVPAQSLAQVTKAFRESRDSVRVKVASRVVYGGTLLKKGEVRPALTLTLT